ncbi:MAG: hypothetical protein V2A73_15540 [Pseudomonadota bacterium]
MREDLRAFDPVQEPFVLWADPLANKASYQAIVPGRINPGREWHVACLLIAKDDAALGM